MAQALTQTLQGITNQVGSNIKLYKLATDAWIDDSDVTEGEIKQFVNLLYRDDLFPEFVNDYPDYFKKSSLLDSWIATGTGDAASTASTLVLTTSVFTNQMADQGLFIYNETDGVSTYVTGFTSATTVTVNATDMDTWVGDSVYIIGQEFTLGGDGIDSWTVERVRIKYSEGAQYRDVAHEEDYKDLSRYGFETGHEGEPKYYETAVNVADVLTTGIGVWPKLDTKITGAIRIDRAAKPADLGDTDRPRLPVSLPLVDGATAWAFEKKGDYGIADKWWRRYEMHKANAIRNWRPDRTSKARKIRISSNSYIRKRRLG